MADQVVYTHQVPQGQEFNKEPTASVHPIPPPSKHARLEVLPMFPLESAEAEAARQKNIAYSDWFKSQVQTGPKLTAADKAGLAVLNATGAGIMNVRKIENSGMKLAAASSAMMAVETGTAVLTRWTLSDQSILVDVLENRAMGAVVYYVKASRATSVKCRGKHVAKLKDGGSFTKTWNTTPVDNVAFLENGGEVEMEQVLRLERGIGPAEMDELRKAFLKQWNVPSPL
jgi:hypothetical protein